MCVRTPRRALLLVMRAPLDMVGRCGGLDNGSFVYYVVDGYWVRDLVQLEHVWVFVVAFTPDTSSGGVIPHRSYVDKR